jgi:HEAT repeat protein
MGDRQAVAALRRALKDADPEVRCAAAEALGRIADPQAGRALRGALTDWNRDVRARAALALGAIGEPKAGDALVPLLRDRCPAARIDAAFALAMLRRPEAAPVLAEALARTTDRRVALRVVVGLKRLGTAQAGDALRTGAELARRRAFRELAGRFAQAADTTAALAAELRREGNPSFRQEAVDVLGYMSPSPAEAALAALGALGKCEDLSLRDAARLAARRVKRLAGDGRGPAANSLP